MSKKELGRIYFPGNPWPKGHAIKRFEWTGRVERSTGIWFDLHLETESYYANDKKGSNEDDDEEESSDEWRSKTLWYNFHSCTLSSTNWGGQTYGFLAGSATEPLDWKSMKRRTFAFDQKPANRLQLSRPFHIYLLGHDGVGGHKIEIKREAKKKTYTMGWCGRIALFYSGYDKFLYQFNAQVAGIPFDGILFPGSMSQQDVRESLDPFVVDHRQFKISKRKSHLVAMPI